MNEVYARNDIVVALTEVTSRLREVIQAGDPIVAINDRGLTVYTQLQTLFEFKLEDPLQKSLFDVIMDYAVKAERIGPGGFDTCIRMILDEFSGREGMSQGLRSKPLEDLLADAPVSDDIDWLLNRFASSDTSSLIRAAFDLAGFAGKIVLEKSESEHTSVELIGGYTFDVTSHFASGHRFSTPKVVVIDGYIEGVHEINQLLLDAAEGKEPVLLFVRGLSDDVLNTLKVNFDRGTVMVIPIVVKFDFEGINTLVDIAMCTAADLKSTAKGDLISSAKFSDAPRVDFAILYGDKVVISGSDAPGVQGHVLRLRKRRESENEDTLARLLDKRIKSLSPNHVVIRMPNDKDYVRRSQEIDYTLRAYRSLVAHGTVCFDEKQLASSYVASHVFAARCVGVIEELGAAVTSGSHVPLKAG